VQLGWVEHTIAWIGSVVCTTRTERWSQSACALTVAEWNHETIFRLRPGTGKQIGTRGKNGTDFFMRNLKIDIYEAHIFLLHRNNEVDAAFTFLYKAELLKLLCFATYLWSWVERKKYEMPSAGLVYGN
jgi:hypothetical protein